MTALAPDLLARVLDREAVARLAVIDDQKHPEVMPIVFARVGARLFSPIDGKPKKRGRLARLRYIERCPRVGLVLDGYAADWTQLWWIKLTALASIAVGEHGEWEAAVAALYAKYPQYQRTPLFQGEPTLICIEIVDVRCWAATGLASWSASLANDAASAVQD